MHQESFLNARKLINLHFFYLNVNNHRTSNYAQDDTIPPSKVIFGSVRLPPRPLRATTAAKRKQR